MNLPLPVKARVQISWESNARKEQTPAIWLILALQSPESSGPEEGPALFGKEEPSGGGTWSGRQEAPWLRTYK